MRPLPPLHVLATAAAGHVFMACAPEAGPPAAAFQVTDSAGVEVVHNAQAERPLALREVLRIGVMDGDPAYQFERIRQVAVDGSGSIWVVDAGPAVRRFSSDGRLETAVGGRGEGPGEATGWGAVFPAGEAVALYGYGGNISTFGRDGTHRETLAAFDGTAYLTPLGWADGRWVSTRTDYGNFAEVFRPRVEVLAGPEVGAPTDTIGTFPGPLMRGYSSADGSVGEAGAGSYFTGDLSMALDGSGRLHVSDSLAYEVRRYGPEGHLERILRRPALPVFYDPGWVAAARGPLEGYQGRFGAIDRSDIDRIMAGIAPQTPPPHLRFIQDILVGGEGTLWAERADRHPHPPTRAAAHALGIIAYAWPEAWRAPRVFDVFDPAGAYVGTAEFDPAFTPMAVDGLRIYGVARNELDVEYVLVYEGVPTGG